GTGGGRAPAGRRVGRGAAGSAAGGRAGLARHPRELHLVGRARLEQQPRGGFQGRVGQSGRRVARRVPHGADLGRVGGALRGHADRARRADRAGVPEPLVTRNAPYTVPVESGAAVLATAAPRWSAVHAGAPVSALVEGPVPSVAPAPVRSPVPSSLPFAPPLPVPSISSEEPPAVLAPLSGPLPWLVPPCACEAWPTADGLASEPEEVDTCTTAGTAVPTKSAAAAMPTSACRLRARRAGTARRR